MQAYNIDRDQIAKGVTGGGTLGPREVNRSDGWHDTNADVGGFVVPDKLWWYGSYRYLAVKQWFANYPAEPQYSRGQNFTGKFTYQLSNNKQVHRLYPAYREAPDQSPRRVPAERDGRDQ
jgi:hypothetical protein